MNEEAWVMLKQITQKTPPELTKRDIEFLYARRSYLSQPELQRYESLFPGAKGKKSQDEKVTGNRPTYKQLQSQASKLGMPTIVGISRETLEAYIKNNSKE